jgi:ABC-type uncharacterized transport system permease subunit
MIQSANPRFKIPGLNNKILQAAVRYGLTILLALLLFAGILLITGKNPIASYRDLFSATFGSAYGFQKSSFR